MKADRISFIILVQQSSSILILPDRIFLISVNLVFASLLLVHRSGGLPAADADAKENSTAIKSCCQGTILTLQSTFHVTIVVDCELSENEMVLCCQRPILIIIAVLYASSLCQNVSLHFSKNIIWRTACSQLCLLLPQTLMICSTPPLYFNLTSC